MGFLMTEEHWDRDKEKFEDDFEGRRDYGDEERRDYGGGYRGGNDTIIENETIVSDDRYGGDQYYKDTTVVRDDGYGDNEYREEYRDDNLLEGAARWTGNKVRFYLGTGPIGVCWWLWSRFKKLKTCPKTPLDGLGIRLLLLLHTAWRAFCW